MDTMDYIWHTPKGGGGCSLTPVNVLLPPEGAQFFQGMPNQHWPSDHVSLLCEYVMHNLE
jgi:mRNA deadenylase 3'-5' endonuclease subunit Ccr4